MRVVLLALLFSTLSCGKGTSVLLLSDGKDSLKLPVSEEIFVNTTEIATAQSLQEIESMSPELEVVTVGLSLDARVGAGVTVQAGKSIDLHFARE